MWRCPHCGAPQAETARCWVCHRSSTTCSTCRHFRRSLAADVGWCALDAKHRPLTGLELRGCWQARSPAVGAQAPDDADARRRPRATTLGHEPGGGAPAVRDFVPVELLGPIARRAGSVPATDAPLDPPPMPVIAADVDEGWAERTSLFGDVEG